MATSPANTNRKFDGARSVVLGINSYAHPADLSPRQFSWAVNLWFKKGIPYTRPGYESKFRLPDGKAQGFTLFKPKDGEIVMVMAVSGLIYTSQFPYDDYTQLTQLRFSAEVDHVIFKQTLQGADGPGNLIEPRALLFMQDGRTAPAYYDGTFARHTLPGGDTKETVVGFAMEWVGSRLWVARGDQIFASDIFDPLHFTETEYLASGGSLQAMDGEVITALAKLAQTEGLVAFTNDNASLIQAGITDRSTWKTTPGFVSFLFPGVGCSSVKSPCYLNGILWWMSFQGARNFTQVGSSIRTSANNVSSIELDRSFGNMSPTISRACGFAHSSFVGFSVPSGDVYNRHTWVLDTASADQLNQDLPPAWLGIWMGTRPVEWDSATIQGTDRAFYISQDRCGVRVWEAFMPDHEDNGGRIFCSGESNGMLGQEPSSLKKFLFSQFYLYQLRGEVDMTVEYRGDWGCWKLLHELRLCAEDCFDQVGCNAPLSTLQGQNRYVKTPEANPACLTLEGPFSENIGTYFQNRIRWYGKNGIFFFKADMQQWQESSTGLCTPSDSGCLPVLCCDGEVDYISHVSDGGYGSGSANQVECLT